MNPICVRKSERPTLCGKYCGFTLVEVIASIAILSTLLVSLLVIQSRHIRQLNHASRLIAATELTDELLGAWFSGAEPFLDANIHGNQRQGFFADNENFFWRLSVKPVSTGRIGGRVLILETFHSQEKSGKPIVAVELLDSLEQSGQLP